MARLPARRFVLLLAMLGCISLGLPLLTYAYLGLFSRYAADDYCTAGQLVEKGLLGMQIELYRVWSGRFSFSLAVGVVEAIGPSAASVLPAVMLIAWLSVLIWLFAGTIDLLGAWAATDHPRHTLTDSSGGSSPIVSSDATRRGHRVEGSQRLLAALLSLAVVYATVSSMPDLGQSLLWQTGVLTYVAPLILLTALAALLVERLRAGRIGWASMSGAAILALAAGGTSETSAALATATLGAALALVVVFGSPATRRIARPLLVAGVAGSLMALAIVAAAPGNAVRQSQHVPNLGFAVGAALDDTRQFLHDWWRFTPFSAAVALLVPLGAAVLDSTPPWRRLRWPARVAGARSAVRPSATDPQSAAAGSSLDPQVVAASPASRAARGPTSGTSAAYEAIDARASMSSDARGAGRTGAEASSRPLGRLLVWSAILILIGLALIVLALLPSFYALGVPQPGRARVMPQFLIALVTGVIGYALGASVRSAWSSAVSSPAVAILAAAALLALSVLGPLRSTQAAFSLVPDARAFSSRWDAVDRQLRESRASGIADARVPTIAMNGTIRGMDFLSRDASEWLNVCAARFYGLRSISAE